MSQRSNRVKMESSDGGIKDFGAGGGDADGGLEEKVFQLQETLKTFRAEVDLKMAIMEQILTTRNEQFLVQKKLLDGEHALYESVLSHWKNTAELASNGLTLKFSDSGKGIDVVCDDDDGGGGTPVPETILGKRTSSAMARRERRKRLRKNLRANTGMDDSEGDGDDGVVGDAISDNDNDGLEQGGVVPDKNSDEDDGDGMETKVFVNYYSEGHPRAGEHSNNPVWKYFLREENGNSAMCKLCDDSGVQKILKMKDGGTSPLHRHLKLTHQIVADSKPGTKTAAAGAHNSSDPNAPVDLVGDAVVVKQKPAGSISPPIHFCILYLGVSDPSDVIFGSAVEVVLGSSDNEGTESGLPKKKKRSNVHSLFELKTTTNRYHCKHCSNSSYAKMADGSTGSLLKHIRTKHPHLID